MISRRTDLAVEARELWREGAGQTTKLDGVKARSYRLEGWEAERVEILDDEGANALGKPVGRYLTIDLTDYWKRRAGYFERAVRAVGAELKALLPEEGPLLVAGLGNPAMTPDAVGPLAVDSVLVTRHLLDAQPETFAGFRAVAAVKPGVLGTTGVETAEAVRGIAERVRPAAVVAVDALASRRRARLCTTVQLSDTGIQPGSGVGNHRAALDRASLGVPVIAVGVPTVVDALTLAADLLEEEGLLPDADALRARHDGLTVTPRDIDAQVRELAKVVGYAVNWAVQHLEVEEMNALLS